MKNHPTTKNPFNIIVIVAALGYFVDIYDLILFSIVRVPSLTALGVAGDDLKKIGLNLMNTQMIGMMVGGIIWGILGDKRGRLSVLFLTIIMYSLANIANGFVQTIPQYYVLRFIAGVGLAGELGVGITLVAEVMSKETRGIGTTIVAGTGLIGAFAGFLVSDMFSWRIAYYVGGGLGLMLLILRVSVYESGMFAKLKENNVERGAFLKLFSDGKRFMKYLKCVLIGLPVWYIIGVIIILAPEYAGKNEINVAGAVSGGKAVMVHYIGAAIGAFLTGWLSQILKSRRRALLIALFILAAVLVLFFTSKNISLSYYYFLLFLLGIPNGYWSVLIVAASEQFGTNLRSTVTTTVPNFVRGATWLMTNTFILLSAWFVSNMAASANAGAETAEVGSTMIPAAAIVGAVVIGLAMYSAYSIEESYHKDLDFVETY